MKSDRIKLAVSGVAQTAKERGIRALDGSIEKINKRRKLTALEVIKGGVTIVYKDEAELISIRKCLADVDLVKEDGLVTLVHVDALITCSNLKIGSGVEGVDVNIDEKQLVDFVKSILTLELIINN